MRTTALSKLRPRALIAALAACLATSSCATSGPAPTYAGGVRVIDRADMVAEYHRLADAYRWPLPPGLAFPEAPPEPSEPTMYQVGEGENQADSFWICSWMGEWIRSRAADDTDAADVAWSWVERADQTALHRERYDDPRDIWHQAILAPARAGHPRAFREFYATSCGFAGLAPLRELGMASEAR